MNWAALLPAALCCGLAGGCVQDQSLPITGFVPLTAAPECAADPNTMVFQSRGLLDVRLADAFSRGYVLSPVVLNNLSPVMAQMTPGQPTDIDRQTVFVNGFLVELSPDPSDGQINAALPAQFRKYEILAAGNRITAGGRVAVPTEVIRLDIARALSAALPDGFVDPLPLTVKVAAFGDHSGLRLNGGFASFPVQICKGCLGPAPGICPTAGFPASSIAIGNACEPQQDITTTCCTSAATGALLCGADVPTQTPTM